MIFKFSQAIIIAVVLAGFAYLNKELSAERVFLLVLYLLLATFLPFIMVPVGFIAIIWSLFKTPSISQYIASLGGGAAPKTTGGT